MSKKTSLISNVMFLARLPILPILVLCGAPVAAAVNEYFPSAPIVVAGVDAAGDGNTREIDINGDDVTDMIVNYLYQFDGNGSLGLPYTTWDVVGISAANGTSFLQRVLVQGDVIGPGVDNDLYGGGASLRWYYREFSDSGGETVLTAGLFEDVFVSAAGSKRRTLALTFLIDNAVHYGWVDVELFDLDSALVIHGWGWEDSPDTGLIAGGPTEFLPNTAPLADAGSNVILPDGQSETMVSGILSVDADGDALFYKWDLDETPWLASAAFITDSAAVDTTVQFSATGDYILKLSVTDSLGGYSSDEVRITVNLPVDDDRDGHSLPDDCNDSDATIFPGAEEIPYDGVDQDCDGADLTDVDADGVDYPLDCNDGDASVYPGATEIKHDGIDQDCNGYDLTIDIISATYKVKGDSLTVVATSGMGRSANLSLDGYDAMKYNKRKNEWSLSVRKTGGSPGTVTVSGIEGSESAAVTTQ